jgi:aspartate racemase
VKTIGLIGGMSWESSIEYYRILNQTVREKLGGFHSAQCVMYSVDFAEIELFQRESKWLEAASRLTAAAQAVQKAGANLVLLCTNTMHKVAEEIQAGIDIPLLHIADTTAQAIRATGVDKVGLLGTRFTMEEDFYKGRLARKHGLEVIVPDPTDRENVHRIIYDELVLGIIRPESKRHYQLIIDRLIRSGVRGIVLGCTEIGLLIHQEDSPVPIFDTTRIHAVAAVEYAID